MKTTLLKLFSKETIHKFLAWCFYRIKGAEWSVIRAKVEEAETVFLKPGSGTEKRAWVMEQLKQGGITLREAAIDYALSQALAQLKYPAA